MKEKIRYFLLAGAAGFIFTFIVSSGNNLWSTAITRACLAFVVWALLAAVLGGVWSAVFRPGQEADAQDEERSAEPLKGAKLDLSTIEQDDQELLNLMKNEQEPQRQENGFTPLSPPKLVTTKNPEELAKAVRHLSEK
ncbi:hypothetical protein [Paenibacillus algicola]|uniref:hypothetical protein n=1 Tax=Paenibacillus algicola TaxID=2565926 RepID=UPI0010FE80EC|nr:hypothetical protein [Paenibacillus algicola]